MQKKGPMRRSLIQGLALVVMMAVAAVAAAVARLL